MLHTHYVLLNRLLSPALIFRTDSSQHNVVLKKRPASTTSKIRSSTKRIKKTNDVIKAPETAVD